MNIKGCKYCLSEIPEAAQKCRYCHEWQEKIIEDSNSETEIFDVINNSSSYLTANKPFQLKLLNKRLPYTISIIIFSAILFSLVQFIWYRLDENRIYLFSFLTAIFQLVLTWSGLVWVYHVINKNCRYLLDISSFNKEDSQSLFIRFNKYIFNNIYSVIFGVLFGLIAVIGDVSIGTPFETNTGKFLFAGIQFIAMLFAGSATYSMVVLAIFLFKITRSNGNHLMSLAQKKSVRKIGEIHLKTAAIAIVPFFLGIMIRLFGNWSWEILIIIWYLFFALQIVLFIYLPMINIHEMMRNDVENQLLKVQSKIRNKLKDITSDPSSSNFGKLNDLRALEKSISHQNTWPFDTKGLFAAFSAIIIPVVLMIIDKIWPI